MLVILTICFLFILNCEDVNCGSEEVRVRTKASDHTATFYMFLPFDYFVLLLCYFRCNYYKYGIVCVEWWDLFCPVK